MFRYQFGSTISASCELVFVEDNLTKRGEIVLASAQLSLRKGNSGEYYGEIN
jgi:hypothetical protein